VKLFALVSIMNIANPIFSTLLTAKTAARKN